MSSTMIVMITAITPSLNASSLPLPITRVPSRRSVERCLEKSQCASARRIGPAYAGMVRVLRISAACLLCSLMPEAPASAAGDFDALTADFVYSSLALSPVTATAQGYHRHDGAVLDEQLDDLSGSGMGRAPAFYRDWKQRLDRLDVSWLDAEQQADLQIIRNAVGLALLDLQT